MEQLYSVLSLIEGESSLPYQNIYQFTSDLEDKTGILIPDQVFYKNGRQLKITHLLLSSAQAKTLQLSSAYPKSVRFFIKSPSGTLKSYVSAGSQTVQDLLFNFMSTCHMLSLSYPPNQFAFKYKDILLPLNYSLSSIPPNSEIELIEHPLYPEFSPISVIVKTFMGQNISISFEVYEKVSSLKEKIKDVLKIPPSQQRLISTKTELKDERELISYNLAEGSTISLFPLLTGGGMAPKFSFSSMENALKIECSKKGPDWRIVISGVSWIGTCNNERCKVFMNEVVCNSGFGVFNVDVQSRRCECPICKETIRDVRGCGFFNCRFSFFGIQANGEEKQGSGMTEKNKYTAFADGERVDWRVLRVSVEALGINIL